MRMRRILPILAAAAVVAVVATLYLAGAFSFASGSSATSATVPNFTLPDIYGQDFTLDHYQNTSVVVIEFTSLSCSECQIVEKSLASIYSGYNASGHTDVQIVSIYIEPTFGDTIPALRTYHDVHNITWTMAQDTPSLAVSNAYGVSDIPTVVVVNKQDQAVYDVVGAQSTGQLQSSINGALSGSAATISLVSVSVFALAAIAGVSTFFSPCAFPMFPGYMSLFLGLSAGRSSDAPTAGGTYKRAVRRALSAGSIAALGMMVVFLIIGVALFVAANAIGAYVPYLLVAVGVVLVALGALLLTNLQYWRVVAPVQALWRRISRRGEADPSVTPATDGRGFYLKLFGYGMGYAAAAAGCVAPVILSAIVAGLALGLMGGIINILIYSLTAALLMIAVTVLLAVAGRRYVNQLNALTPVIKKVTAVVLVIVGVYLVYFFYTAWVL